MDYSQFLHMPEEISLLLVILIVFFADLFLCPEPKGAAARDGEYTPARRSFSTWFPVALLLIHVACNFCPHFMGAAGVERSAFGGMYLHTAMMTVVKSTLAVGTLIVFLMGDQWLGEPENRIKQGEFHLITLFTLLGMYFMISAGHFLMFFIGLELASVPMAALVAWDKYKAESAEAGGKFILLALFSSALLLYGLSLIYGGTGTLYFNELRGLVYPSLLTILGLVFFIAGMGFKISLVPFHLWTADTYEGAPVVVTGFLSVISKGAAAFVLFVILVKVFGSDALAQAWNSALFWIIIASITIANLFAIRQKNLKRFMAFSAISQAGYLILGIMGGTPQGMTALVFYLLVYLAANLGAFAVLTVVERQSGKIGMDDYNGLYQTNPHLALLMTLCLFSLAGIPPFAGFFSKFFIFMAAFKAGYWILVLIALVNTVISLYYYLLIVKAMYINKSDTPIAPFKSDTCTRTALLLCTAGVLGLGIISCIYNGIDTLAYGL